MKKIFINVLYTETKGPVNRSRYLVHAAPDERVSSFVRSSPYPLPLPNLDGSTDTPRVVGNALKSWNAPRAEDDEVDELRLETDASTRPALDDLVQEDEDTSQVTQVTA
jgi:hypothetical protein